MDAYINITQRKRQKTGVVAEGCVKGSKNNIRNKLQI